MNTLNIKEVNELFKLIVPEDIREKYYDPTKYPKINGYNLVTSFRNGGKTTQGLIWSMCANKLFGTHISYVRTDSSMITESKVSTLFDAINSYTDENGRNYIQKIYGDKYNRIYYLNRRKVFVLGREDSNILDLKNAPVLCYVHETTASDKYRSGFADPALDIIIYDEMVDEKVCNNTFLRLMHMISTFMRTRYNSIIFMFCNLSTGKPTMLSNMEIYTKLIAQDKPYAIYTTELGTKIGCEILEVSESFSMEREKMNRTFFGFKADGMEIIRGSSIVKNIFREIEDTDELTDTHVNIRTCGVDLRLYMLYRQGWQKMFAVKPADPKTPYKLCMTDDPIYAFEHPYTYTSICRETDICLRLIKAVRRNDVCYDNYMTQVYMSSFCDLYKVPTLT